MKPSDDLRHRPEPGERMRDSLFWQVALPEERLAVQVYLFVTGTGAAGYNVAVWGPDTLVLEQGGGRVPDSMDFDDFTVGALTIRNEEPLLTSSVSVAGAEIQLDLAFRGAHEAFSFRDNPDGLPTWFADDRLEQTGHVSGRLTFTTTGASESRTVELGPVGHRDHSWGLRDWRAPQHWKWLVAYTPSGRAVNGWIWQARGEWGFAGYVTRDGRPVAVSTIEATTRYSESFEQEHLDAVLHDVDGGTTRLTLDVYGVLHLPDERTGTTVLEGASIATIDGEPGAGQFETLWPTSYFEHLAGV
ncbi:DUF7064 domain-containing protein [Frondihabitans cladoniiphilus]|uniref:DUF7064 domain-containing protein n=1 Tax=Frondihabitans cladoniiphilus TaxID=715785 RepID=A0ABP8WBH2_9MICO